MSNWINTQRVSYKDTDETNLTSEQLELLEQIDIASNHHNNTWKERYDLAKKYYEYYGNVDIPIEFQTLDGIHKDENGIYLGRWVSNQRKSYNGTNTKKISPKQIQLLEQIGFTWNYHISKWKEKYDLAKKYYEHYGNLEIPIDFQTFDGINEDENGIYLGRWLFSQKQSYRGCINSKITFEKIVMLEKIGIEWLSARYDNKSQHEQITSETLKRKKTELLNRFYSVLNNYDTGSLPPNDELNERFLYELRLNRRL